MSLTEVDRSPAHLFPAFRSKLEAALTEAEHRLNQTLFQSKPDRIVFAETYRSEARQLYLYEQGRTRPGSKVTWTRSPRWHGSGLAADVFFQHRGYDVPHAAWKAIYDTIQKHGLFNPVFAKGDLGHVQWNPSDEATRRVAQQWVRAGFSSMRPSGVQKPRVETPGGLQVFLDGTLVSDAFGYLSPDDKRSYVWVRAVLDELGCVIVKVTPSPRAALICKASWEETDQDDDQEPIALPLTLKVVGGETKGFVRAVDLAPLGVTSFHWQDGALHLGTK